MIKKLTVPVIIGVLFSGISFLATGQNTEPKKTSARPDIPGTFTLELGLNRALDAPSDFSLGLWGARSVNLYYQYEMRILKSRMSFVPGIGVSLERYKFKNDYIIDYEAANTDAVRLISPVDSDIPRLKKSQLIANYVEVPLEIRYSSKPDDPTRSFKAGIGGRIGYMYDGFSKIKYKADGEVKQLKDKQNFNLNRLRYGVFGKIGIGNFSLFGYYNLTPLFKDDKGFYEDGVANNFNTFTVGISLSSF